MAIRHKRVVVPGEKGTAADWNAEHVIDESSKAKRSVTLIVAASDSKDKDKADYVCDGTADEAEIGQAILDLPAHGGEVRLLEGTYNISTRITFEGKSFVTLSGQGRATEIVGDIGEWETVLIGSHCVIRDLKITGRILLKNGTYNTIMNVECRGGIFAFGSEGWLTVKGCYIHDTGGVGIFLSDNVGNHIIVNNLIDTTGSDGIYVDKDGDNCIIAFNRIKNSHSVGISIDSSSRCNVIGNIITDSWQGVRIDKIDPGDTCSDNTVTNNQIPDGFFDGGDNTIWDNNQT